MIKEMLKIYKEEKRKNKEKQRLLTSAWDVQFLQDAIQKCNKNPNLKVKLAYPDGRWIELVTLYNSPKIRNPYEVVEDVERL